jgi:8-oxo-dGTP pyrophosphatase MutT (NUDIX family)
MTAIRDSIVPEESVSIRATAGLIFTEDGRYLLQHRDGNPEIIFPHFFCLFGGTVEESENPAEGLRRELWEELELEADRISYFSQVAFDAVFADGAIHQRYYFEVPVSIGVVDTLTLHEGAGMKLMTPEDITREMARIVPYDLAFVQLHRHLRLAK